MVPELNPTERALVLRETVVHSFDDGAMITVSEGLSGAKSRLLNFSSFDFLGLANSKELKDASLTAFNKVSSQSPV